jgi:pilus assembly protein Flp/PilA
LHDPDQFDRKSHQLGLRAAGKSGPNREKSEMNLRKFLRDESGATAIEYGLIAACIAIAIIVAAQGVGTQLNATFEKVAAKLDESN